MATFPFPLSETLIRQHTTSTSFARGQGYYHSDAVLAVMRRGQQVYAEVAGSQYEPYQVCISFSDAGVEEATCSCPYDWGGWCKHIVATLLLCLHEPESVEERPPVDDMLASLNEDQLRDLMLAMIDRYPDLADMVESFVQGLSINLKRKPPPAPFPEE